MWSRFFSPSILIGLLSAGLYVLLLYGTERASFGQLITLFAGLFGLYAWAIQKKLPWRQMIGFAILFRLIALFALPQLSDDYFRFIWDGKLLLAGESPFLQLPSEIATDPDRMQELGLKTELYEGLNSKDYYTIYPPILQVFFFLSALLSPNSIYGAVLLMKCAIFLAELGSLYFLRKLIIHWGLPMKQVLWYALNPLVIVELCGNLHFEAFMIFFLLAALYLLVQNQWHAAAISFAGAVCSKLLPLMLLPLFLRRFPFKKNLIFGLSVAGVSILLFLPIIDLNSLLHFRESLNLYVSVFEFNASFWYLIRGIGYYFVDYNVIRVAGPILSLVTFVLILAFSFLERKASLANFPKGMLWVFWIYFSLAGIVHPWYACVLVALAAMTKQIRFPLLWTALLPLSYFAYQFEPVSESLWLVSLEYGLVWGCILYSLLFRSEPVRA